MRLSEPTTIGIATHLQMVWQTTVSAECEPITGVCNKCAEPPAMPLPLVIQWKWQIALFSVF